MNAERHRIWQDAERILHRPWTSRWSSIERARGLARDCLWLLAELEKSDNLREAAIEFSEQWKSTAELAEETAQAKT